VLKRDKNHDYHCSEGGNHHELFMGARCCKKLGRVGKRLHSDALRREDDDLTSLTFDLGCLKKTAVQTTGCLVCSKLVDDRNSWSLQRSPDLLPRRPGEWKAGGGGKRGGYGRSENGRLASLDLGK